MGKENDFNSLAEDAIEARNKEPLRKCYTRLSIMVDHNDGNRNFTSEDPGLLTDQKDTPGERLVMLRSSSILLLPSLSE